MVILIKVIEPPTEMSDDEIYCVKQNLHDRKPTAAIIRDFMKKSDVNCDKNVKIFSVNLQVLLTLDGDKKYGFEEFSKKDIESLELKLQIIRFMKYKERKEKEIENITREIEEKIEKVFPKIMERINRL
ncbi:hypothetical protein PVAND_014612 [Polypedilum vanderplanki]|uniref:Uncharacterized protein n=1 Tax=Polypedilum vanderplanki TaxID=319348 RepID=A0A9J6BA63_POLVA|nr:hypothetical protein PVAND_014612 [Polypedilum vanderplanki]